MRILFLTQWFQPENFFKGLPFAKALQDRGHEVEVLTGFPNYPSGKVYPNYHVRPYQQEMMDGIKIHRLPLYPSHDRSPLRRIINYISFSLSSLLMGPWLVTKPDVIYVYNLVTLGVPAFLLRFLYDAKVIIDVQDLWPESVASSGMLGNNLMLRGLNGICNWVYRRTDKLVVLSPGFKKQLICRGVAPEKIEIIYNWFNESSLMKNMAPADSKNRLGVSGKFVVLFAGTMGLAQGLDTLLDCAHLCRTSLPDVQFILIGDGVDRPRIERRAEEMRLNNVTFLPPRPVSAMEEVFEAADALLVHLKDAPLYRITIPSKTQAYLYMGKPIIMAMRGDAADLIAKSGAGVLCEPDMPDQMLNAIRSLYELPEPNRRRMGERGHDFYMKNLSFGTGIDNFTRLMKACLK